MKGSMNKIRGKVERSGVQMEKKIQRPRFEEVVNTPTSVLPTHLLGKVYNFT